MSLHPAMAGLMIYVATSADRLSGPSFYLPTEQDALESLEQIS